MCHYCRLSTATGTTERKLTAKRKELTPKNGGRIEECLTLDIFFMDDPLGTFLSRMFLNRPTIAKRYFCEQFLQKEQRRKRNLSSPGESDMIFMCVNLSGPISRLAGCLVLTVFGFKLLSPHCRRFVDCCSRKR